jgi:hypothetical protein
MIDAKIKRTTAIVAGILGIPFFLCVLYAVLYQAATWYAYATWRNRTTPLDKDTVSHLCSSPYLNEANICSSTRDLYAPDFFPAIEDFFTNGHGRDLTKTEVDFIFSDYELSCGNLEKSEGYPDHYRCWYDLRGDRAFEFMIAYTSENEVYYVNAKLVVGD